MFWTGRLFFVEVIGQTLAENVIRDMGLLGVMEIVSGQTTSAKINLKLQLLQRLQQQLQGLLSLLQQLLPRNQNF